MKAITFHKYYIKQSSIELCSMLCGSLDGKGVGGRMGICIYMAESLHCSPETITTLLIGYTSVQNKKFKKKANTIWCLLYVESKTRHKWTYLWNRNRLADIENRLCGCPKRMWVKDVCVSIYLLLLLLLFSR